VSPLEEAGIAFALIVASAVAGALLRFRLPEHHLTGDSKDVIKLAVALIATMSALVLALLFASTRTSYERTTGLVSRMTVDIIQLDKLLGEYGPLAKPIRLALRNEVPQLIDSIWQEDAAARGAAPAEKVHGDSVIYMLRGLEPTTKVEAYIQAHALQISTDLEQIQFTLLAQPSDSISNTFLVVLVLWLMFIFAVFSMSSPPNATLFVVLFLCIMSAAAAIYLILELGLPFGGLMEVPNGALRAALSPLS
jgi:ABC-type amino acid transport system permease subunit